MRRDLSLPRLRVELGKLPLPLSEPPSAVDRCEPEPRLVPTDETRWSASRPPRALRREILSDIVTPATRATAAATQIATMTPVDSPPPPFASLDSPRVPSGEGTLLFSLAAPPLAPPPPLPTNTPEGALLAGPLGGPPGSASVSSLSSPPLCTFGCVDVAVIGAGSGARAGCADVSTGCSITTRVTATAATSASPSAPRPPIAAPTPALASPPSGRRAPFGAWEVAPRPLPSLPSAARRRRPARRAAAPRHSLPSEHRFPDRSSECQVRCLRAAVRSEPGAECARAKKHRNDTHEIALAVQFTLLCCGPPRHSPRFRTRLRRERTSLRYQRAKKASAADAQQAQLRVRHSARAPRRGAEHAAPPARRAVVGAPSAHKGGFNDGPAVARRGRGRAGDLAHGGGARVRARRNRTPRRRVRGRGVLVRANRRATAVAPRCARGRLAR